MPIQISASDEIVVRNTPEQVWKILFDVAQYPVWWPKELNLRILAKTESLVGSVVEVRPKGGQAFRCRFVAATEPGQIEMKYEGFVTGVGQWILAAESDGTRVTYSMNVQAKGLIVTILGRFVDLGPIHSKMMRSVLAGLESALSS